MLEVARNRQNDRVYGKRKRDIAPNRLYHETSRFTKKVMVSAGVSWKGKTRIHFIDTEHTKVNSESYKNLLEITARLSPVIPQWRLGISTGWSSSSHEQDHSGISWWSYAWLYSKRWVASAEPRLQPDGLCGLGLIVSKGLCRETGQIHREQNKKTDSKVLERHYPQRNTKDNISLEKALANSGGWKWWTYRSSCLKNCNGLMISHNLTVTFVRPAIQEVLDVSLWNLYLMLITSYINRTQNYYI